MKNTKFNSFLKNNSSTILTIIGSVGVGVTAVISAIDTAKALHLIDRETEENPEITRKDKIKIAAPCYIPTIVTGASTILCICGANKLNKDMQKSLTSAYVLLDQSYKKYRDSVNALYGDDSDSKVIQNIASNQVEEIDELDQNDTEVFFDFLNLRWFNSTLAKIKQAEIAANEMLKMHDYISLGTLYSFIGADVQGADEMVGWSTGAGRLYGYDSIKFDISEEIEKDGYKYYVLDFADAPTTDYMDL